MTSTTGGKRFRKATGSARPGIRAAANEPLTRPARAVKIVTVENGARYYLEQVSTAFNAVADGMEPAAREVLERPKYDLSRLLLGLIDIGGTVPAEAAIGACLALELLSQALASGQELSAATKFNEEHLLMTDYYYAAAIEQVVPLGLPAVIGVLARAITGAAEDRMSVSFDMHGRLTTAAIELSLLLGEHSLEIKGQLRAALDISANACRDWPGALPAGSVRETIMDSISVAAGEQ